MTKEEVFDQIIRMKWTIIEGSNPYRYHCAWFQNKERVSPFFEGRDEAVAWMDVDRRPGQIIEVPSLK